MRLRTSLALISALAIVGSAAGCTAADVDWAAAEASANEFTEAASQRDGFRGSGSMRADDTSDSQTDAFDVELSYRDPGRIGGATAVCFGDGEALVSIAVREGSNWAGLEAVEVPCTGEETPIAVDASVEAVNAVGISAHRSSGAGGMVAVVLTGN